MKKTLFCVLFLLASTVGWAQGEKYDTLAIFLMDRMSDVIGDLQGCSYTLHTSIDEKNDKYGIIRHYGIDEVYMSGPNKMLVSVKNHKGHQQYMYNGIHMAYYSFTENNYGMIEAPPTTIEDVQEGDK